MRPRMSRPRIHSLCSCTTCHLTAVCLLPLRSNRRQPHPAGRCPPDDRNSQSDNHSPSRSPQPAPPSPQSLASSDHHYGSRYSMSPVEGIVQCAVDQRDATRSDMNAKQRVSSTAFDLANDIVNSSRFCSYTFSQSYGVVSYLGTTCEDGISL